ncbi:MarR family winged helix-turn-helix transcriptional regulator [Cellulomonas citrea]|uniref:MarR family winged helix-turn-helix transcriptional regulator n=1 Tax=Cellulomonas citrea TaxID=1909423 RepID=UPI00135C5E9B|nr:MarR family winged helix-turn-helix transcriptional regulator [Cellulomonas citrea]
MPLTDQLVAATPAARPSVSTATAQIETLRALEDLNRAQRAVAQAIHESVDAPVAGVAIVRMLARHEPRTLGEVAAALRVDLSVASRQVSCLVDQGMVERSIDDADRRIRTLRLTEAGRELSERVGAELARRTAIGFASWTVEELHEAVGVLERLAEAVAASSRTGPAAPPSAPAAPPV